MKKNTKLIIALALIAVLIMGVVLTQTQKNPQKDGQDLVFESEFGSYNKKEYYELLKEKKGDLFIYLDFERNLLTQAEKTNEIIASAKAQVADLNENAKDEDKEMINQQLKSLTYKGIEDLEIYFQNMELKSQRAMTYAKENLDTFYPQYKENFKPRMISHILIPSEDGSISEDMKTTMAEIDQKLKDGETFANLATAYSQDGSASNGGDLGLMDKNTNFVPEFLEAALALNENETSTWVKSQFGVHLIKMNESGDEIVQKNPNFYQSLLMAIPKINSDVISVIMQEANVVFEDESLEKIVKTVIQEGGSN